MCKEAYDDYSRHKRDKEMNTTKYDVLNINGYKPTNSMDVKVG
jgi:hypothetical protein